MIPSENHRDESFLEGAVRHVAVLDPGWRPRRAVSQDREGSAVQLLPVGRVRAHALLRERKTPNFGQIPIQSAKHRTSAKFLYRNLAEVRHFPRPYALHAGEPPPSELVTDQEGKAALRRIRTARAVRPFMVGVRSFPNRIGVGIGHTRTTDQFPDIFLRVLRPRNSPAGGTLGCEIAKSALVPPAGEFLGLRVRSKPS